MSKQKIQTLKGFRDFLPEDWAVQNYIFKIWKEICLLYGFEEYNAPLLEPIEIYSKSGDDVGTSGKELYTFTDRGGREIALRPEMTPSVGKLVANYQNQLTFPVKWFSIAQFFRAEKPQRGRTREFFQLNADIFGSEDVLSDFEIISLSIEIMKAFKATKEMFVVRINNRLFADFYFSEILKIKSNQKLELLKIIDAYPKKDDVWLKEELIKIDSSLNLFEEIKKYMSLSFEDLKEFENKSEGASQLVKLFELLRQNDLDQYCVFDPRMARGFDYYTGMVFEVFDNNPENNRSLFGGGRYDDLLDIFGEDKVPAVGFAPGDVTIKLFLESWGLLPKDLISTASCLVTVFDETSIESSLEIAKLLRSQNISCEIYPDSETKLDKQLKYANKKGIPNVIIIGPDEAKDNKATLKNMKSGEQQTVALDKLPDLLRN